MLGSRLLREGCNIRCGCIRPQWLPLGMAAGSRLNGASNKKGVILGQGVRMGSA